MDIIDTALETLELERNATSQDIKQAYRDLVKVWHPDRFPTDLRIRCKAEEKLKKINAAYDILQNYDPSLRKHSRPYDDPTPRPYTAREYTKAEAETPKSDPASSQERPRGNEQSASSSTGFQNQTYQKDFKWYTQYVNFEGRANRGSYWRQFFLFNIIFAVVLFLDGRANTTKESLYIFYVLGFANTTKDDIYILYVLTMFLPGLAITVRRLHDIGKNGWWILLIFLSLPGWIGLFNLVRRDGDPYSNKWGPPPE
jgi:uncharacterized membrane protein YhaH (DUF805 family)